MLGEDTAFKFQRCESKFFLMSDMIKALQGYQQGYHYRIPLSKGVRLAPTPHFQIINIQITVNRFDDRDHHQITKSSNLPINLKPVCQTQLSVKIKQVILRYIVSPRGIAIHLPLIVQRLDALELSV